jgi:type I restriction enzyme S subunit
MNKGFPMVPLGRVIRHRKEFIRIDDLESYKRCRVQLHAKGIVLRDVVAGSAIKTKAQQVCRARDFLVAEIDAKVGGFGIVPDDLDGAIVSTHYFLFQIDDAVLNRRFLDFFIRTPAFRDQVLAQGSTNYAAIRPNDVLSYEIPLPPLEEQRRIVARIEKLASKIDEARSLRGQSVQEADGLARSVSHQIFRSSGECQEVPLESVCADIIDNLHSNPLYAEEGVPCVRSPDVGWGELWLDNALRTSEEEYIRRTVRGEPRPDDIVLVREGGGTGKAALVKEGQRFSLGQRVMLLRPDKKLVQPKFLLQQLLSPAIHEEQVVPLLKGSASPHLNIGVLRKLRFLLPSLSEQARIVIYLDSLRAKIDALTCIQAETAAELDALMPSILNKAFKGEL